MSDKDNHPAQTDTARPIFPLTMWDGNEDPNSPMTDWRAKVLPADAPEEEIVGPKESAAAPVDSSATPTEPAPPAPATPASTPVTKVIGKPKVPSPGRQTSS